MYGVICYTFYKFPESKSALKYTFVVASIIKYFLHFLLFTTIGIGAVESVVLERGNRGLLFFYRLILDIEVIWK
jgi:hypothetical protein